MLNVKKDGIMRKKIVFAALFLSLVCGGAIGLYGRLRLKRLV